MNVREAASLLGISARAVYDLVLTDDEIRRITGYQRGADQLRELHRQGFYRARRARATGDIIVERDHYLAVCSGGPRAPEPKVHRPTVRPARIAA